jgi:CarD family transcriptional regulator
VTQTAKPASPAKKPAAKAAKATPAPTPAATSAEAEKPAPAPRKAMTNAAAAQALMASATASKEAAARTAARAVTEKAAADKAAAEKAAAPPPPPVQTISPPVAMRPGMSRPGMPGMRPAFSITPRMPMGALRSGGMAEAQAGAPTAPKGPPVKVEFRTGDMVVYPTHGVGTVQGIEDVNVAGISLQVITVTFEENRMTLRVPTNKAASAGLRKLAGPPLVKQALDTLKGRARIKRTMWSRRAQENEAKINSGDPVAIAEVVRDLFRNAGQPDQSFSERQIYEQALDRLAMEFAAIEKTDKPTAIERLIAHMRSAEKPGSKVVEEPIEED